MSQWIGIHGINQQYLVRKEICDSWKTALAGGVEWATGQRIEPCLDIAFYGTLFRDACEEPTGKGSAGTTAAGDLDDEVAAADLADATDEEIADLESAVEEMAGPGGLTRVLDPRKTDVWLPAWAVTLVGAVEQYFPLVSGLPVLAILRQVGRYLRDPGLKAEVDQIAATAATGATVLIGHSLGSVVAYEYLRQNPGHSVELLVTVGSPLGLKMVRKRLLAGDPGVAQWVNVRDPNDPVTAGNLGKWYPQAQPGRANNGPKAHSAENYLSSHAVGEALRGFIPGVSQ